MSVLKTMIAFLGIITFLHVAQSADINQASSPSLITGPFAADLLQQIATEKSSENIIFSPLSIQSALVMAYLGAAGTTAEEMRNVLHLANDNVDKVGTDFSAILNQNSSFAEVSIANRIFVNSAYELQPEFNERSKTYFNSEAEKLNFTDNPLDAIATINSWVEQKTNNKIKNLMEPKSVGNNTAAVIVNAIYFKGRWENPFFLNFTDKSPFWITADESVDVDTMYVSTDFKYGVFPELDATGMELPYRDSNISMLLLLPNQRNGLANMESKMGSVSLIELGSRMSFGHIFLSLPKFKVEFTTKLTSALKKMGIHSLFENADLPGIFQSGPPVRISDVQHKAYIEVDEFGSEAAASTRLTVSNRDFPISFDVNHPFLFAIKSPDAVYFVGHIVKIET